MNLFLSVLLLSAFTALSTANCMRNWTYFEGTKKCYQRVIMPVGCAQAESMCASDGGHLVSIHTAQENEFVSHMARVEQKLAIASTWIGLKWDEPKKQFEWTDKTTVDYFNWKFGDPKGMQVSSCVELYADEPSDQTTYQTWGSQLPFFTPHSFTCKMDPS